MFIENSQAKKTIIVVIDFIAKKKNTCTVGAMVQCFNKGREKLLDIAQLRRGTGGGGWS